MSQEIRWNTVDAPLQGGEVIFLKFGFEGSATSRTRLVAWDGSSQRWQDLEYDDNKGLVLTEHTTDPLHIEVIAWRPYVGSPEEYGHLRPQKEQERQVDDLLDQIREVERKTVVSVRSHPHQDVEFEVKHKPNDRWQVTAVCSHGTYDGAVCTTLVMAAGSLLNEFLRDDQHDTDLANRIAGDLASRLRTVREGQSQGHQAQAVTREHYIKILEFLAWVHEEHKRSREPFNPEYCRGHEAASYPCDYERQLAGILGIPIKDD